MSSLLRPAIVLFLILTVLTGIVYPLVVTGIAQVVFPAQAGGSLIVRDGKPVGSRSDRPELQRPEVFLEPAVGHLTPAVQRRRLHRLELGPAQPSADRCRQVANRCAAGSGSGQHGARPGRPRDRLGQRPRSGASVSRPRTTRQPRVARARGLKPEGGARVDCAHAQGRLLGVLGEPRVNVLELNLALDALK